MTYKKQLEKRVLAGLLAGAALWLGMPAALAASGAVPNTQLPQGGSVMAGNASIGDPNNGQLTITQGSQNAVIQWGGGFNVGANATVNFEKGKDYSGTGNFNTLNYDASGNMSQIYGAINAQEGNIYIVNPAGVEISSSAQINVGSLYVSNKNLADDVLKSIDNTTDITKLVQLQAANTNADAVLMSLGNINADHVTFDGGRIVIDTERLKTGDDKMIADKINVRTTDAGQVVLGYDAYNADKKTYEGANNGTDALAIVNEETFTKADGYMWVEDIEQLQAVNTNPSGQYALRNSIDATATKDWADGGFKPIIGKDDTAFTGKFDGLDYNIFNLKINRDTEKNVGLFGVVGNGAVIRNVTLVGGSITGGSNVGALAGQVSGGAQISNIMNSASVTGSSNVGGIIGAADQETTDQEKLIFKNLVNTGTVAGTAEGAENNAGGLIGSLTNGTLSGTSYNLGGVTGKGSTVGGLVGKASNAALGDGTNLIYNRLNVSGLYNVGGIVGFMTGTTVQNAENSGNVTAAGYTIGDYTYHTAHYDGGTKMEYVYVANAGGIAGKSDSTGEKKSEIKNVQNSGDVSSDTASGTEDGNQYTYYTAGNVGGIVGSAVDTNISNATNEENDIRGAHNVGGIAGYFSGTGTITTGINNGGDILATGARDGRGFVTELVRGSGTGDEEAIIGNMGGIVGYLEGDNVSIISSANRGTVHSQDITGDTVLKVSQAANAGGIVGKIDRANENTIEGIKNGKETAAVKDSYNTGDVRGYMGVGGVAGMMYNGAISGSYNLGTVNTTRNAASFSADKQYYTVNMGGIVGDTTEGTNASSVLYDVYNKGQIGDETFTYYARHVGGIVGRLSGDVEKAYNTGAIYNGYNVVGGIAGWMFKGSITNSFNTGNITVNNQEATKAGIQAGGIVGGASTGSVKISNVYNLGTIRGFQAYRVDANGYAVGGIVGAFIGNGEATVSNAYTTGNLYLKVNGDGDSSTSGLGSIYGTNGNYSGQHIATENTYYIRPADKLPFKDLSGTNYGVTSIGFDEKDTYNYTFEGGITKPANSTKGENVEEGAAWRIYAGSTPILNAFLPNTEDYFSGENGKINADGLNNISSIQYGTAYDPLLTIINANTNTDSLTFNWKDLGINNAAGLAVYGANLTLNDFMVSGGSGYFGGLIYSDGALTVNAHTSGETHNSENTGVTGDVALGSASQLYGSSVSISADGNVTIYGNVTATGNTKNGATGTDNAITDKNPGNISITGGSVDVYGQLTSAKEGEKTKVPGINGMAESWTPENVSSSTTPMTDIGDRFGYTTGASTATGSISITAEKNGTASEDGHVNVYYGHQQKGFINTAGNLTVSGFGDVYMDSDLSIGGNLSISAGADSEAVLDISNIGQVQATKDKSAVEYLHDFLRHFASTNQMTLSGGKQKIAVDMWTDNAFDLDKFDYKGESLSSLLNGLNINGSTQQGQKYTYIWVSTGEELKNIQAYYKDKKGNTNILSYNFALKNDIDASAVKDYVAIGTDSDNGFTGTFDGRDNRIIGLKVDTLSNGTAQSNAGIFNTIGTVENEDGTKTVGKVEDLRVYSGTFNGTDNAGTVAGINNGTISNVTTFGNVVTAKGSSSNSTEMPGDEVDTTVKVGAAGGIAGVNAGTISNASASDAVTAADDGENDAGILSTAGGIAGINKTGAEISDSSSDSAVNASAGSTYGLGGIAGVNDGTLSNVDSLGVTTGIYEVGSHNTAIGTQYSDNVGGIAGRNSGTVSEAYNESIVSGHDNVGGILGKNTGKNVENVSNAARVTGEAASGDTSDYVGGLVGSNSGSITNGRNNGKITGSQYVGGLVGNNASGSKLSNLVNDEAASIIGDNYVGGIAGRNYGTISANDEGLVNRGSITGQMYVGGVAGSNEEGGIIENTISSIALHVKTPATNNPEDPGNPKYFGGVVGQNSGTINGATNESSVDVAADGATMVGGIIGQNTENGKLEGTIANKGFVSGKSDVGGIIGSNENQDILNNADTDENGQPNKRLVVSNSGRVQAEDGGAAGIFYENTGAINNADLINTGMVIGGSSADSVTGGTDSTSVTGGLFGKNSGTITNSTLTNNGTVYGGGTVGGLIGENKGDISTSSLINSVNGKVIGLNNVGGLIGQNYGTITGGRDENDGYYKYQIYNNGTITVGKWTDTNKDGKIADGEIMTDDVSGSNIGGLVGLNGYDENTGKTGSITAAYNTGAIIAGSSTNVGGIAGSNTGKLDQVFNTVITGVDDKGSNVYGSITGNNYVGGIVGSNTGTVSNAYNTSTVSGSTAGAIAGTNNGTISNVYTTVSGGLVGKNDSGTIEHNYDVSTSDTDWEKAENYEGFDFTGTNGNSAVWKIYEGSTNPLLKVFLTKVTYNPKNDQNLVYNGKDQTLDVTGSGFTAADDFAAHNNVSGGLIYHDVAGEHKNAGTYTDNLWSEQIKAGSKDDTFNPNNLGYDVQSVEYKIDKAVITVAGNRVDRTYGNGAITSSTDGNGVLIGGNKNYGFTVTAKTDITNEMKAELTGSNLGFNQEIIDGALSTESGKTTNDVDKYTWRTGLTLSDALKNNYTFSSEADSAETTVTGTSYVNKATITVDLIDVNRTYGNTTITNNNGKYGVTNISGVTNGDSYTADSFNVTVADGADGALDTNPDDNRVTNDANKDGEFYIYTGAVTGKDDGLKNNYNIVVNNSTSKDNTGTGKSYVDKANLTIDLSNVNMIYGQKEDAVRGQYGYAASEEEGQKLVNGDKLSDVIAGMTYTNTAYNKDGSTKDVTEEGYELEAGDVTGGSMAGNYSITYKAGKVDMDKATITVGLDTVERTYGNAAITNNGGDYGVTIVSGVTNGDDYNENKFDVKVENDGALATDTSNGRVTSNVGDHYTYTGTVTGTDERLNNNYNIVVNNSTSNNNVGTGTSKVNKAEISVSADSHQIYVGAPEPTYTGTKIEDLLVNGDSLNGTSYEYGPQGPVDTNQSGETEIGIHFGDTYFGSGSGTDWSGAWDGFKNYNVTFMPGTLTVEGMPSDMPEISDGEKWNSLLRDTPWDRNENFRERKAEIHFIAGGMSY